jgi:hypothetical protein
VHKEKQIQFATQTYEELLNEWSKEQSSFMQRFLDSIGNMVVEKSQYKLLKSINPV